ncbi:carbon-nitrogen hydrolase family protein [Aneurinibacillus migulanus]|uniref:carbon-nitrogen hydrolase family protein n=1 Tax=Aneurinibacillus migulanus TaxID=47500 RepID=UPI000696BF64|nr:nitrilase-related carbon-nitrogen hydrolase [Aneurinibacillus migulanus]
MKIKVAAVQFEAGVGLEQENRLQMKQWINTIMAEHPDCSIIVFPELVVSGYDCGCHMAALAEEVEGESYRFFSEEARRYGVHIAYGNIERSGQEDRPYNTVWLIGSDGSLLHTYRKIHLASLEEAYFTPGEALPQSLCQIQHGPCVG